MVDHLLIEALYKKRIALSEEALASLDPFKTIALFCSVQFIRLDTVKEQLGQLKGKQIITSHGKRTSGPHQLLGCDCFQDSFADKNIFAKADVILYIGDGLFHPKALLLAQLNSKSPKDIILYDPLSNSTRTITRKDIEAQAKRYKANLVRFIAAETIGILVSTKSGQRYLKNALLLKENLKNKRSFIFIDDTLDLAQMENFDIDCWVNTACPRIGFDDLIRPSKPIININDAFNPEHALENYG